MRVINGKPNDLQRIKEETMRERNLGRSGLAARITVHLGTCGLASGAGNVLESLKDALRGSGRKDVVITTSGCIGFCSLEPLITVETALGEPVVYQQVDADIAKQIFAKHVQGGEVVMSNALARGRPSDMEKQLGGAPNGDGIPPITEVPFFARQRSLVLENRGRISPDHIEDYIFRDGYTGAVKALLEYTPQQIINEIKTSGLRGRGGGGFPTGIKWEFAASTKSDVKYVLCNADEGDPGAFMDRSVMEADPHKIIEGMIIAARAIGAHKGYIYCRAEYPLALEKLDIAIGEATAHGLLGRDILGSGFALEVEVYKGAGAFVCGEETALIHSIEGNRGTPRPRPPFPAVSGLFGRPTILNNVETYANVPWIIRNGGDAYAAIGTAGSKGTKVFALTGKVKNTGLVEVPMGTPIGDIIFDIGGGIPGGKTFKAAQLGGPSGGCLPAAHLNTRTDYEAISKAGAIMGSGGLIVMDQDTCMVDMARYFMEFCQDESCGKCTPCRVGTKRMLQILERICAGDGEEGDIELLESLAYTIKDAALCGLGQTAPNPVLSTLQYFRDEYEAHIRDKRCPAASCTKMFKSPCQHACPIGMDIPTYVALLAQDRIDDAYTVLKQTNPFPSVCGRVCTHPCQLKCRRGEGDAPVAIRDLKRFIADHAARPVVTQLPTTRGERIAVVGAGPSGLTAALELKRLGYDVTVFESLPLAGGMLRYGIPPYRLPRDVLDAEIQDIIDTGVVLKLNTAVGTGVSVESLLEDFDAVYLAVGAQQSLMPGIPGEDADGVIGAIPFLSRANQGKAADVGRRVVVIGGGSSSMDAARSAMRLGAEEVTVAYRRTRDEMPAMREEIIEAKAEGIHILELVLPTAICVNGGKVTGVQLADMTLGEFDSSGRRRPVMIDGSTRTLPADIVVMAIGNTPDLSFAAKLPSEVVHRNRIVVDRRRQTAAKNLFAGGDVTDSPAIVIHAIKDGRDAAREIDAAIRARKNEAPWVPEAPLEFTLPLIVDENADAPEHIVMPEREASKRRRSFDEVQLGYTKEMAIREASRCLRCDLAAEK